MRSLRWGWELGSGCGGSLGRGSGEPGLCSPRTTRSRISSASSASRPASRSSLWASCCTRAPTCATAGTSWTSWWFSRGRWPGCAPSWGWVAFRPRPRWSGGCRWPCVGTSACHPWGTKKCLCCRLGWGATRSDLSLGEADSRRGGWAHWFCGGVTAGVGLPGQGSGLGLGEGHAPRAELFPAPGVQVEGLPELCAWPRCACGSRKVWVPQPAPHVSPQTDPDNGPQPPFGASVSPFA